MKKSQITPGKIYVDDRDHLYQVLQFVKSADGIEVIYFCVAPEPEQVVDRISLTNFAKMVKREYVR